MTVKKESICIRLYDQPGQPFELLKVRNPRRCDKRVYNFRHTCFSEAGAN